MSTETLVGSQSNLAHQLAAILADHPAGSSFRLMFAPVGVEVAEDEVLVQVVNAESGVIELRPRKLDDLSLDDTVHATQVLDPGDDDFNEYAATPMAGKCLVRYDLHKNRQHIYD
ncbi:hypothetical protein [Streptomyces scabiei]|nr:hypothetical protein [Streptomyces scabiei]MBP5867916.1 hypothetical protein [Streptomyces sp. LBUM 1485]MDX2540129.1 hypothetical protein [Streptomyces scabiei]MDX2856833.1 hypothetical protein [Streptomyces scabiei]MDX3027734.1 hypothetical protein [Streptomyces scabiei]MDX3173480.1 hypothetical protein [Streptomyces scabiei]